MRVKFSDLLKKISLLVILLFFCNIVLIIEMYKIGFFVKSILYLLAVLYVIMLSIYPESKEKTVRLKIMQSGRIVFIISCCGIFIENMMYIIWLKNLSVSNKILILNAVVAFIILVLLIIISMFKIVFTSKQVSILNKVLFCFMWWIPVVNLILCYKISKKAKLEYIITKERIELDSVRVIHKVCQTKYPVLMVHGVFFRDWQFFNYWGRIPKYLIENGAVIYYGKQQSASSVENSARELAEQIKKIVDETGCEKVNIIAHSKGGLDARYAISNFDVDRYVASLTTINTPHLGCVWAQETLKKLPNSFINFVANKYNRLFSKLGDIKPDFISAVNDLTVSNCEKLNDMMPDKDGILYQAYMSKMNSRKSAGAPLCFVYPLVKKYEKDNDGLVSIESGTAWHFKSLITVNGKRGISHGDVIDLMREDIKEFDIKEFFVNVVEELKKQGL